MVKDHHEALKMAIQLGKENKSITIGSICQLNATVMKSTGQEYNTALGTVDSTKGELRKGAVFVGTRYFPAHDKVPVLLDGLCTQLNEKLRLTLSLREQVDLSYTAHFNLVGIHPHYDGNGRTSRLLMNQFQRRFKLPLSCVYKEDKQEYFEALEKSGKEESFKPFRKFMDNQYIKSLSIEIERYKSQNQSKNSGLGTTFLY